MLDKSEDRDIVARRLAEDLIGPRDEHEELLARPSDVYLTGILWPQRTQMSGEDDERLGTAGSGEDTDGEGDAVRTSSIQKPSVAGISFSAISGGTAHVRVICSFATYRLEKRESVEVWVRQPHILEVPRLEISPGPARERPFQVLGEEPTIAGLNVRCVMAGDTVLATLTLVNQSSPEQGRDNTEASTFFQTEIRVEPCEGTSLVPKPPRRPWTRQSRPEESFEV